MTGQMKRYRESLKETPEPILLSQIQTKMDLRGLMKYAKENNKPYRDISVIVAHLGGGITLSLHHKGQIVDMISAHMPAPAVRIKRLDAKQ